MKAHRESSVHTCMQENPLFIKRNTVAEPAAAGSIDHD
jgi:hypothetical protein